MTAPFRIHRPGYTKGGKDRPRHGVHDERPAPPHDTINDYLQRLMLMIPGEVVSLYLVGIGLIPEDKKVGLIIWAVICLLGVVAVRAYGTMDKSEKLPTDWIHVGICAGAFVIWVYTLGGPFKAYGLYVPYIGSLAVLVYTFFAPLLYKGPKI